MPEQRNTPEISAGALSAAGRREVTAAYGKLLRHEELTRDEQAALRRFEQEREERLRWQHYRSIPKKHWRQMSGRQAKVINEQAARYKLPLGGPTINLEEFVVAFHDFLSQNAQRLAQVDDACLRSAQSSPALEKYREERARLAELDRLERERVLMPRELTRSLHYRLAMLIRRCIERLELNYGRDAAQLVLDMLDDYERELDDALGEKDEEDEEDEEEDWRQ